MGSFSAVLRVLLTKLLLVDILNRNCLEVLIKGTQIRSHKPLLLFLFD